MSRLNHVTSRPMVAIKKQLEPSSDGFARLCGAIITDIKHHVDSLRKQGIEFYGYAALPPDYYTAFDPTTMIVVFNCESDIDDSNRDMASYYRYSVDEWQNYVHEGFDTINSELKSLLRDHRASNEKTIGDDFISSIHQSFLDALSMLRNDGTFDGVPYVVIWISDSGDRILNRSAKALNSPEVYSEFASEFGE